MSRIIEDDRITYIYLKLIDTKQKKFIEELIQKLEIASISTARRRFKELDKWSNSDKELFLATYIPTKSDSKAVDEVLGVNTGKASNEVKKEPVSEKLKDGDIVNHEGKKYKFIETGKHTSDDCRECDLLSEFLKDDNKECLCNKYKDNGAFVLGYFVEVAEEEPTSEDKCTECDTEAAHIINELSAKNEELQKELHTSKNVITTLKKGIEELNEIVTESKCMIAEVCKERDDKDEEIRVLSLELQKYKNDLNIVLDDRQKLECLLHDSMHSSDESKEFRDIIEKMIQLHTAKNKDYGNAFSQTYNEFGVVMSAIRINDKLNRFKTLIRQNSEVKTESIIDTLADLANYAVMTIIEIVKQEEK